MNDQGILLLGQNEGHEPAMDLVKLNTQSLFFFAEQTIEFNK